MVHRYLSLSVAVVAPASAAALLVMGARPIDAVSVAERASCVGLAILAAALAIGHLRIATTRAARIDAAMWWGLTAYLCVATFARPHLGFWLIFGTLWLAAISLRRLVVAAGRPVAALAALFRRRNFA